MSSTQQSSRYNSAWISRKNRCHFCDLTILGPQMLRLHLSQKCWGALPGVKELWKGLGPFDPEPELPWANDTCSPVQKRLLSLLHEALVAVPSLRPTVTYLESHPHLWVGRVPTILGAEPMSVTTPKELMSWRELQAPKIFKEFISLSFKEWKKQIVFQMDSQRIVEKKDTPETRKEMTDDIRHLKQKFQKWLGKEEQDEEPHMSYSMIATFPSNTIRLCHTYNYPPHFIAKAPRQGENDPNSFDAVLTSSYWAANPHLDCPIADTLVFTVSGHKIWFHWPACQQNWDIWDQYVMDHNEFPNLIWCVENLVLMDVILASPQSAFFTPAGTFHAVINLDQPACHITHYGLNQCPEGRLETLSEVEILDVAVHWNDFLCRYSSHLKSEMGRKIDVMTVRNLLFTFNSNSDELSEALVDFQEAKVTPAFLNPLLQLFCDSDGEVRPLKMLESGDFVEFVDTE